MKEALLRGVTWNLFLAVIPVALGYLLSWGLEGSGKRRHLPLMVCLLLGVVWFAFVPNTCYLLTEWRHLLFDEYWRGLLVAGREDLAAMLATAKWALLFLAYSGSGVLLYVLSIRPVESRLRKAKQSPLLYAPFFFFAIALGVYLGLIDRLNSWDIIHHPRLVLDATKEVLFSTERLIYVGAFAVILWVLYEAVDLWIDAFKQRVTKGA